MGNLSLLSCRVVLGYKNVCPWTCALVGVDVLGALVEETQDWGVRTLVGWVSVRA